MELKENYSLKKLNTFGIDVKVKQFVTFVNEDEIFSFFKKEKFNPEKTLIIGGGSNILFSKDYDGIVIKSEIAGINELKREQDNIFLEVGSGVEWDELVTFCVNNGYGGIENLTFIPGKVGAAPIQNIGAYGVEFEEVFEELEGIDLNTQEKRIYKKAECNFSYRDSVFKSELKNIFLINKVTIRLSLTPKLKLSYRAIQDYIKENKITNIDLKLLSEIIKNIRKSKLPDPEKIGNAGSFFKNPIINRNHFEQIKYEYPDLVYFEIADDSYKIPAGWLIEKAGLKGKRIGEVGVHANQALVLVNYGSGTGSDILNLSNEIKSKILKKFNIILETEVNII